MISVILVMGFPKFPKNPVSLLSLSLQNFLFRHHTARSNGTLLLGTLISSNRLVQSGHSVNTTIQIRFVFVEKCKVLQDTLRLVRGWLRPPQHYFSSKLALFQMLNFKFIQFDNDLYHRLNQILEDPQCLILHLLSIIKALHHFRVVLLNMMSQWPLLGTNSF